MYPFVLCKVSRFNPGDAGYFLAGWTQKNLSHFVNRNGEVCITARYDRGLFQAMKEKVFKKYNNLF